MQSPTQNTNPSPLLLELEAITKIFLGGFSRGELSPERVAIAQEESPRVEVDQLLKDSLCECEEYHHDARHETEHTYRCPTCEPLTAKLKSCDECGFVVEHEWRSDPSIFSGWTCKQCDTLHRGH